MLKKKFIKHYYIMPKTNLISQILYTVLIICFKLIIFQILLSGKYSDKHLWFLYIAGLLTSILSINIMFSDCNKKYILYTATFISYSLSFMSYLYATNNDSFIEIPPVYKQAIIPTLILITGAQFFIIAKYV